MPVGTTAASRPPLPIDSVLREIVARLRTERCLVVMAPPGAGKTTRIPVALLEGGLLDDGALWLLQPRRVAARAAARRISAELGDEVGGLCGFVIRDERRLSAKTKIVVVTEGVLTRRLVEDPALSGLAAVMLDEFHERSRHADLALAMLKEARETVREDLRVVVASATLDAEPVQRFLGAGAVRAEGRTFPIEVRHAERVDDRSVSPRAAAAVSRALQEVPHGDVLVFLPGAGEIRKTAEALGERDGLDVVPLHGDLAAAAQDRALLPAAPGRRKVILSTNIAETSLTIEGVGIVVDSGLARVLRFDPRSGLDRLVLSKISKASVAQRGGRAGRLGPGVAYRLFTRHEERSFPDFEEPEIRRVDLAPVLLDVLSWAARDPETFGWFDAPPPASLRRALSLLRRLGAVEPMGFALTARGREMSRLPIHPRLAAVVLDAKARGFAEAGALLAALLEERDVLKSGRAFGEKTEHPTADSDLLQRYDLVARSGRVSNDLDEGAVAAVRRTRDRILRAAGARSSRPPSDDELRHVLLAGFPDRVARRRETKGDSFVMVGGKSLTLDRASVVREAPLVVVLETSGGDGSPERIRLASAIEAGWLRDVPGGAFREETVRFWDDTKEAVLAERRSLFDDLVLDEQAVPAPADAESAALLARAAGRDLRRALTFDERFETLRGRVDLLARTVPERPLPRLDDAAVLAWLPELSAGRRRFDELRAVDLSAHYVSRLAWDEKRFLDDEAPLALSVPTGRSLPVRYAVGEAPILAVKLQELFGLAATPRVAKGRVPVVLHLLSPAGRPVQVTSDLTSFWNTTYKDVRKDLRGRYPKHPWPEDPWNAPPMKGTRR